MVLQVRERLILLSILPNQGDFTTLKIVRKLREDLSFSEDEHALLKFQNDSAREMTLWDLQGEKSVQKDVDLGDKAKDIIRESLVKLSNEKKLLIDHMDLYEKFCVTKE
jgi:hypothetical protein